MSVRDHEKYIAAEVLRCKHFNGVQNKICKAGVNYDDVSPLPCFPMTGGVKQASCEKKECWSAEEAEANFHEKERLTQQFFTALAAASEDAKKKGFKKGHGGQDSLPCPVCKSGTLRYSVASYNGHLWGQCSTKGCVSWMQ